MRARGNDTRRRGPPVDSRLAWRWHRLRGPARQRRGVLRAERGAMLGASCFGGRAREWGARRDARWPTRELQGCIAVRSTPAAPALPRRLCPGTRTRGVRIGKRARELLGEIARLTSRRIRLGLRRARAPLRVTGRFARSRKPRFELLSLGAE